MPPVLFLLKFLSSGRKRVNETPEQFERRMASKRGNHFRHFPAEPFSKEEELYELICEGFNKSCRSFRLVDTHNNGESGGLGSLRPDLCLYHNEIVNEMHIRGQDHRSSFGVTEAVVEVKRDETQDPFSDHPTNASDTTQSSFFAEFKGIARRASAKRCVGQISTYVSHICARQHRTHCFTISIYGHSARFMRWDRAGVTVSESFNYCNTQWLSEFARLFDKASDADRGYDMTIRTASPEEENIFRDVITKHVKSQVGPDDDMVNTFVEMLYEEDRVYKVALHPEPPQHHWHEGSEVEEKVALGTNSSSCNNTDLSNKSVEGKVGSITNARSDSGDIISDEVAATEDAMSGVQSICQKYSAVQYFLVSRPVAAPLSVTGRGTRGYWAVKIPDKIDKGEHKIAFLKDTWRIDVPRMQKEGEIMIELVEAGIPYVSDIFCHGDVLDDDETDQRTLTDMCETESWNRNKVPNYPMTPHVHYRMASVEVGFSLKYLLGTKELIHATLKAFIAALEAKEKCGRLHRDISVNNIILVRKDGEVRIGILIDWELSCKSDRPDGARNYARSGSWAFMSANSLRDKVDFKHTFEDDMESFFYVVLYAGLLWLPHEPADPDRPSNLTKDMTNFFGDSHELAGKLSGGNFKVTNILSDGNFTCLFKWKNKRFGTWVKYVQTLRSKQEEHKGEPWWTVEAVKKIWEKTDAKFLPNNDRYEHKINGNEVLNKERPMSATTSASASRLGAQASASTQTSTSLSLSSLIRGPSGGSRSKRAAAVAETGPSLPKRPRRAKSPRH